MSHALILNAPPASPPLSNVMRENQETYNRLAQQYDQTGGARLVQAKRWLRPVLTHLRQSTHPASILELGPADGHLTGYLAALGYDVTAVEFAPAMAATTRRNAPTAMVIEADFLGSDLEGQFDVVLCSAFAHLFPAPWDQFVLEKVRQHLRPDGIAYLATTVHRRGGAGFEVKADNLLRYRRRYTPAQFEAVMKRSGLVSERFYVARDRISRGKVWGNWIATGGAS